MVVETVPERRLDPPEPLPWCRHAAERDAYRMIERYHTDTGGSLDEPEATRELAEVLLRHGGYDEDCARGCDDE